MIRLWRSNPVKPVPKAQLFGTVAALWAAPLVAGWIIANLINLASGLLSAEAQLTLYLYAMTLIFSPIYAWIGWSLALPLIWMLLRDGWFGWGTAAAIGLMVGSVAGSILKSEIALPFGLIALLALRVVLGRTMTLATPNA